MKSGSRAADHFSIFSATVQHSMARDDTYDTQMCICSCQLINVNTPELMVFCIDFGYGECLSQV